VSLQLVPLGLRRETSSFHMANSYLVPADLIDVCRVCRLEADEFNPMVYPCKCSGSVRYVHPDW
jgi:E3 ubiquitin-protein ligase DOA10